MDEPDIWVAVSQFDLEKVGVADATLKNRANVTTSSDLGIIKVRSSWYPDFYPTAVAESGAVATAEHFSDFHFTLIPRVPCNMLSRHINHAKNDCGFSCFGLGWEGVTGLLSAFRATLVRAEAMVFDKVGHGV